jgi:hypothetical protein
MKKVVILLAVVILSGCYSPSWYRSDTTYEQMRQDSENCKGKLIIGSTREQKILDYEKCMKEKGYVLKGEVKEVKQEVPAAPEIEKKRAESWDKGNLSDQVWVWYITYHNDKDCLNITGGGTGSVSMRTPIMMTRGEAIRQGKVPCGLCVR